jgi:hypothetical protein
VKKLLPIILVLFAMACQKAQRDEDTATNTAQDVSLAQSIFSDAYKNMRIAALGTQGISSTSSSIVSIYGCETISSDTISDPKEIIIDFKYIGCEGLGKTRSGRLIGEFHGKFPEVNSAMDLSFSNYYFEGYEVNGKVRVIFKEPNSVGNPVNTFFVTNGLIAQSIPMTWTASQNWETLPEVEGETKFTVKGASNGINRKGNVFFAEILSGLTLSDQCVSVMGGSQELKVINLSDRTVLYENTSCTNQGVAVVNGARIPFSY